MSITILFKHLKKFFLLSFIFLSLNLYPSIYRAFSSDENNPYKSPSRDNSFSEYFKRLNTQIQVNGMSSLASTYYLLEPIEKYLYHEIMNAHKLNNYNKSFLHFAAGGHLSGVTQIFLEMSKKEGIDLVNLQAGYQGISPLLSALISRFEHSKESEDLTQTVKILLNSGADPNLTERLTGNTPLYWAIKQGYLNTVKILIEAGANPHLSNEQGETHLHAALNPFSPHAEDESYQLEIIEMLYEMKVDLNAQTLYSKLTPLHSAVIGNKPKIVQYLISKKVHLDLKNESGNPPLFFALRALRRNRLEITKMLLAAGANPNFQDLEGNTILHLEIPIMTYHQTEKDIQTLKKRLEYLIETVGIDPSIKNNKGETALNYALKYNHPVAIQEVLARAKQTTAPCHLLL